MEWVSVIMNGESQGSDNDVDEFMAQDTGLLKLNLVNWRT